ncbi:hypothetical protein Dda_2757 [Drechslerella dactyloides]|uniref:Oxidoreductase n=1 Tax=Drechslerella dactyloides TaxID=74499 RepID=A0AAD6J032_DREDA|nr:hypothetical protein Dda_2757 [Drechslerella dactyloides]
MAPDPELLCLKAVYSRRKTSVEAILANEATADEIDVYADDAGPDRTYDELLKRPDVEFVIIALPIIQQPEYIKKALLAGKHVLSEKPVAKDLAAANELIRWKASHAPAPLWGVAENFRYWRTFEFAAGRVKALGRILAFHVDVMQYVAPGGKYFETAWRKAPEYQGGFCLDAGVHFAAALRMLVNTDAIRNLTAFTALNQPHLIPIDTISATLRLASGATGTFIMSHGTPSAKTFEWRVVCEGGSVKVMDGQKVEVKEVDMPPVLTDFSDNEDWSGVKAEVRAFAEAVRRGVGNEEQSPENAVADLELIEKMIKSGEQGGVPFEITGGMEHTSILGDIVEKFTSKDSRHPLLKQLRHTLIPKPREPLPVVQPTVQQQRIEPHPLVERPQQPAHPQRLRPGRRGKVKRILEVHRPARLFHVRIARRRINGGAVHGRERVDAVLQDCGAHVVEHRAEAAGDVGAQSDFQGGKIAVVARYRHRCAGEKDV